MNWSQLLIASFRFAGLSFFAWHSTSYHRSGPPQDRHVTSTKGVRVSRDYLDEQGCHPWRLVSSYLRTIQARGQQVLNDFYLRWLCFACNVTPESAILKTQDSSQWSDRPSGKLVTSTFGTSSSLATTTSSIPPGSHIVSATHHRFWRARSPASSEDHRNNKIWRSDHSKWHWEWWHNSRSASISSTKVAETLSEPDQ